MVHTRKRASLKLWHHHVSLWPLIYNYSKEFCPCPDFYRTKMLDLNIATDILWKITIKTKKNYKSNMPEEFSARHFLHSSSISMCSLCWIRQNMARLWVNPLAAMICVWQTQGTSNYYLLGGHKSVRFWRWKITPNTGKWWWEYWPLPSLPH